MISTTPRLGTITKPLLAEAVHDRLLASVISGELSPGERLNIDELASTFGVSRTPVREALTRLSHARLVEISRNASTAVADWGLDDMRARAQMLGGIARSALLAAPLPGADTIGQLGAAPVAFVHVCVTLVEPLGVALATQIAGELAAPLEMFLAPEILAEHGVTTTPDRLVPALDYLIAMLDADNRDEAAAAVEDLTLAFVEQLTT